MHTHTHTHTCRCIHTPVCICVNSEDCKQKKIQANVCVWVCVEPPVVQLIDGIPAGILQFSNISDEDATGQFAIFHIYIYIYIYQGLKNFDSALVQNHGEGLERKNYH